MEANEKRLLVIGLPETGKSSFIQALDEVLKHPDTPLDLRSCGLAHDRSYLQSGKEKFRAGEVLGRTDRQMHSTSVELWFEHPPTKMQGVLHLPDEKGENFLDQWVYRQWRMDYRGSLKDIAGALVFVRADEKSRNEERLGILASKTFKPDGALRPWDIKEASAQVQLVDVLQFIADSREAPHPLRIAVLVSAWDTVGNEGDIRSKNPTKFLEREWALLAQYLRANPEYFITKTFGVSAYGGVPGKLGTLCEKAPHERAQLTEGTHTSRNLTRPIKWLLQLD